MPIQVQIQVEIPQALAERVDLRGALRLGMRASVEAIARRARQNVSGRFLRIATGKLRRGIRDRVQIRGGDVIGVVRGTVFYGHMHEGGSARHEIRPKRRGALRFQAGGRTVFAARVMHPGVRPRPWFRTAVTESEQEVQSLFEAALAAALLRGESAGRTAA